MWDQFNIEVIYIYKDMFLRYKKCFVQESIKIFVEASFIKGNWLFFIVVSDWQIIFGGQSPFLNSVELFNWRTGQQCTFPSLPNPVYGQAAIAVEGTVAYCGGLNNQGQAVLQCFKLQTSTRTWVQVSWLNTKCSF